MTTNTATIQPELQSTPLNSMAAAIDAHDWAATPLGARDTWPLVLRFAVDTMLGSGHAMCLAWGDDRTLLYNDAYAPFLGDRHPAALGLSFQDAWHDVWADIAPLVVRTFAGETSTFHDMPLEMTRHGYAEETWWTFSYSPVRDEAGAVAGLLNVASESTARVVAERERDAAVSDLRASEAFLSSVLGASTDCIKVLDLDGKLAFMTEGGQRVMEVSDFNEIAGCPWPDFWAGAGNDEAVAAIEAARRGETRSFIGQANTFKGTPKWWHVAVSPILDMAGRPRRILSVSRDITELRRSEEQRDRFARLVENSNDFVAMIHTDGRLSYMNDAGCRLTGIKGVDAATLTVADLFAPDELRRIAADVPAAVADRGHWAGELTLRHGDTGEAVPVLCSVFPMTDAGGVVTGYGSVMRDFRPQKAAEEQLHLLNGEMSHRLKNTLGVVQAIASQTLGGVDRDAVDAFGKRLIALSTAHDVLLQQSWAAANIRDVAARVLGTFDKGERLTIDGPAQPIGPRATLALSLLLHELATNAAKYGALSTAAGHVTFSWGVSDDGARLVMRWIERGGPPVVAPTRKGFGSRIIRMGLSGSGGVELRYEHDGLSAEMTAPLDQLQLA